LNEKTIILLDKKDAITEIGSNILNSPQTKIFSFSLVVHKYLKKRKISHIIADNYLDEKERDELFHFTINNYNWFEKNNSARNFVFENINLFNIMDKQEFHEDLLTASIQTIIISKIINCEKPQKIITTSTFIDFLKEKTTQIKLRVIGKKDSVNDLLTYDKVDIRFNFGKIPISLKISKKQYTKVKELFESCLVSLQDLWYSPNKNKKAILLLEFNPSVFPDLIFSLNKLDDDILLFNTRRSAIWNLESMKILQKTKCKILDHKKFLKEIRNSFDKLCNDYIKKLEKILLNTDFYDIFSIHGISVWPMLKFRMLNSYKTRIPEYLKRIFITKKIIENLNLKCIICQNEIGETESVFLKMYKKKFPSILLLHGFSNYNPETAKIRWKYEQPRIMPITSQKFLVWGKADMDYYLHNKVEKSTLIELGNPRYDSFFKNVKRHKAKKEKTVLITPEPITEFSGQGTTQLAIKYENLMYKIYQIINKLDKTKIVVKLHPGQNKHNYDLIKLFKEIDPKIPVYQIKPIKELIEKCDMILNITCEAFDPSTVMLEGLIFEKPILEISLDEKFKNFEYKKGQAIVILFHEADIEYYIKKILHDKKFNQELSNARQKKLEYYLSNHGNASQVMTQFLKSLRD